MADERSPRKEARPRIAFIGIVAEALSAASLRMLALAGAAGTAMVGERSQNVEHGLVAEFGLAARLERRHRRSHGPGRVGHRRIGGQFLPSVMKSVP